MASAFFFATGIAADAFDVATRIPTLLRDLFAEGAMSAAFVPTFTRYHAARGRTRRGRLGSQVINALLWSPACLVVLGIVFAEPLVRLLRERVTPDTPDKFELTIWLTRVNMPFLLLVAVAAACMGMLNALQAILHPGLVAGPLQRRLHRLHARLTPLFMSHGHRAGAGAVARHAARRRGADCGAVAGAPARGLPAHWMLDLRDPRLREVLLLMGPGTLGVAAAQINLLVNTSLATARGRRGRRRSATRFG